MSRGALTRFHAVSIAAALLAVISFPLGSKLILLAVFLVYFILVGLGVTFPQMSLFGPFICRGNATRKCVALTFDDGPDARSTPELLELLQKSGVKAAFFGVGKRVDANTELAGRIVAEGHLLENHSHIHSNATNFFTSGRLREELENAQAAIAKATGNAPRLFRPPMGLSNPRIFKVASAMNLTVVGWTARGLDTKLTDPERIVARIVRKLEPGGIILLHDGNIPAGRLIATVKLLLDKLREHGYEVERLDRLLT